MWPKRVGGIAATCAEAFRPYSPVLANLTGVCYWWGWVPTCGFTAILSATALHEWYLPWIPVTPLAIAVVLAFAGDQPARRPHRHARGHPGRERRRRARAALRGHPDPRRAPSTTSAPRPSASTRRSTASSASSPPRWPASTWSASPRPRSRPPPATSARPRTRRATSRAPCSPAARWPACSSSCCRSSGSARSGPPAMGGELMTTLGPDLRPAARRRRQGGRDLVPDRQHVHGHDAAARRRLAHALAALRGRPAAALLGQPHPPRRAVGRDAADRRPGDRRARARRPDLDDRGRELHLPDRHQPALGRRHAAAPQRARARAALPRAARDDRARRRRRLRLAARHLPRLRAVRPADRAAVARPRLRRLAALRLAARSPTAAARACRGVQRSLQPQAHRRDGRRDGARRRRLPAGGQLGRRGQPALVSLLQDIFVAVAILTITVGLVLPGIIAHAVEQISDAAARLATGTLADLTRAMRALSAGDLEAAKARVDVIPVDVRSRDEVGAMARSFNLMQDEVGRAAEALDGAREGLGRPRPSSSATSPSRPPSRGSDGSRSRARTSAACCRRP